jgi:flagellar hook protein FlgE
VDTTAALVEMITAQRNFQANAQMIQTEDQVTQSIINIRGG